MKILQCLLPLLFLIMACSGTSSQKGASVNNLTPFATGLTHPVCISNCGDSRLFITDQSGLIRIVDSSGKVATQPFLDIHERVVFGGEQGLLGLAFHPQYAVNGYFYVNYVGKGDSTHISRFSMVSGNPNLADPQSELKLLTIFQPFTNHNGGDLQFGPDGFLYIGLGDGGSGGDPGNRAQNIKEYLGKMLRIDVDHGNPYSIPASNPFYNNPDALGEIWAFGLRNPWRFSFDRKTGDLWIADVGQNAIEEIDFQPSTSTGGENYGWRCYEGNRVYDNSMRSTNSVLTYPVFTYPHAEECSVTGGYVYRGNPSSPYYGYYFFADYCSDRIWTLHKTDQGWISEEYGHFAGNNFSTFGEDSKGRLYVAGITSGTLFLVESASSGITENENIKGIKILQPASGGKIQVELAKSPVSDVKYILYNISGNVCYSETSGNTLFDINTGKLSAGVYILKIVIGNNSIVRKIFIPN
jgi:glucose/arabinose dehydrogenase